MTYSSSSGGGRRWYLLIGVILGLVLMVVIKNIAVHSYIEGRLSDYFGAEVNVGDVSAGFSTVTLEKVQLSHPINPTLDLFAIDEVQASHSLYSWLFEDVWQIDELLIIGAKQRVQRENLATLTRYLTTIVKPETKADPARLASLFDNVEKSRRNLLVQDPKLQDSVQFDQIRELYHNIEDWEYRLQTTVASIVSIENGVNPDKQRMTDLAADLAGLKKERRELDKRVRGLKLNYQQKLWDSYVVDVDNVNLKEIDNILWSKLVKDQLDELYIPIEYLFSQFRPKGSDPIKFKINTAKVASIDGNTYQVGLNNFQSWYEDGAEPGSLTFSQFRGDVKVYDLAVAEFKGVNTFNPLKVNLAVEDTKPRSYKLVDLKNRKLAMTWPRQVTRVKDSKIAMAFYDPQFSQTGFSPSTQQLILKTLEEARPLEVNSAIAKKDGFLFFGQNGSNFTAKLTSQTTEDLSSTNKQNTKRLQALARQQLKDIKTTLRENLVTIEERHYANIKLKPKALAAGALRPVKLARPKPKAKPRRKARAQARTTARPARVQTSRRVTKPAANPPPRRVSRIVTTRNGAKRITIAARQAPVKPKVTKRVAKKPNAKPKRKPDAGVQTRLPAKTRVQSRAQYRATAKAAASSSSRSAAQTREQAKRRALQKLQIRN